MVQRQGDRGGFRLGSDHGIVDQADVFVDRGVPNRHRDASSLASEGAGFGQDELRRGPAGVRGVSEDRSLDQHGHAAVERAQLARQITRPGGDRAAQDRDVERAGRRRLRRDRADREDRSRRIRQMQADRNRDRNVRGEAVDIKTVAGVKRGDRFVQDGERIDAVVQHFPGRCMCFPCDGRGVGWIDVKGLI